MRTLVFATNNKHKLDEVRKITSGQVEIVSLSDIQCHDEIPETADTLEGNALQKARYIHTHFQTDCVADETGLEVEALNGAPGVYSARYAGPGHDSEANMRKLLVALEGESNRKARFRTVIALILDGKEYLFEGIVNGRIIEEKKGSAGFGYDPIFYVGEKSYAELTDAEKDGLSHRGKALALLEKALEEFLRPEGEFSAAGIQVTLRDNG